MNWGVVFRTLPPHPNVVQMYGVSTDGPHEVDISYFLFFSGSLDKLLFDTNQPLTEEMMLKLIRRIASGLLHLHKHNIVHRDLAARNILLTASGDPKISVLSLLCLFFISFTDSNFSFCNVFIVLNM
jgi:serine/threonine protein kinase